mgnify:CR=1 FL=1
MHVRCLNIARQLELRSHLMRSVGIADTTMTASAVGSVVRIDSFPEVSRWAHTSFDWRGLGFIRDADAEAFAGLVLQRVLGTVSPAKVATNDAAPPPRAAPVEEAEAASPLPAAGRRLRSCNCERYHPHWCAEDERRRMELPTRLWNRSDDDGATGTTTAARWPPINFVLDGDIVENRSWGERQQRRTQEFSTNMSNIWNRSKTCRGSALGRSTATMTCPLRDRGSPCGPVPISFDASHEWVIRQIDTRWPLKPQYVEFPCHEYIQFPSAALGRGEGRAARSATVSHLFQPSWSAPGCGRRQLPRRRPRRVFFVRSHSSVGHWSLVPVRRLAASKRAFAERQTAPRGETGCGGLCWLRLHPTSQ